MRFIKCLEDFTKTFVECKSKLNKIIHQNKIKLLKTFYWHLIKFNENIHRINMGGVWTSAMILFWHFFVGRNEWRVLNHKNSTVSCLYHPFQYHFTRLSLTSKKKF